MPQWRCGGVVIHQVSITFLCVLVWTESSQGLVHVKKTLYHLAMSLPHPLFKTGSHHIAQAGQGLELQACTMYPANSLKDIYLLSMVAYTCNSRSLEVETGAEAGSSATAQIQSQSRL